MIPIEVVFQTSTETLVTPTPKQSMSSFHELLYLLPYTPLGITSPYTHKQTVGWNNLIYLWPLFTGMISSMGIKFVSLQLCKLVYCVVYWHNEQNSRKAHVEPRTVKGSVVGLKVHGSKLKVNNIVELKISQILETTHISFKPILIESVF